MVHVVFNGLFDFAQAELVSALGSAVNVRFFALAVGKDGDRTSTDFDGWATRRYPREGQAGNILGFDLTTRDGKSLKAEG